MFEIGRLCVKIAGRDAGKKCVILDTAERNYVFIDGETRRKKCNVAHLEPLDTIIKIEKGAEHSVISEAFSKLNLKALESKSRKKTIRPRTKRKTPEQLRTQREEKKKQRTQIKKKPQDKKPDTELEKKLEVVKEVNIAEVKEEKSTIKN